MKQKWVIFVSIALIFTGWVVWGWWSSAIRQPHGFSHAQHVAADIACSACHNMRASQQLPGRQNCIHCHKMNLPETIQWVPIYRVAPDVIFSHSNHMDVSCATCHPDMTSAKRVMHETRYKMDFCMECHAIRGASNACGACHKNR